MDSSARGLFLIFSIFGFLQIGSCYQCYSCAGAPFEMPTIPNMPSEIKTISSACADPIRTNELQSAKVECNDGMSTCSKIEIKIGDVEVVMRGCLPPQTCTVFKDCTTCTGNLCNSSSGVYPSLLFISVISLIIAKLNL
ncbi:hypothetical protein RN001_013395 [Aquatica leii]|uniref:Protein sleepless n=1 Tax=Aquatica leii TaxID=1421715 RepID=A0AAN7SNQ3_9COLE|nr:hypothetical protein RN001_013395 [Aquatica leii]